MAKQKKDKITIRKMISNALYMVKYACLYDKKLVMAVIVMEVLSKTASAVNDTFILKIIIDGLMGKASLKEVLIVIGISLGVVIILEWLDRLREQWTAAKMIRVCGRIQRILIEHNSSMDLLMYDVPEYYDDFIVVSGNSDEMVQKSISIVSRFFGCTVALLAAVSVIATIDPVIALFPLAGFMVNLMTRFKIEELNYKWDIANRKALRKADYSKRIFYQPEFAKECKLTNVKGILQLQFDEAIHEAKEAGKKYAFPLTWLSLVNWIFVFTVFSFFAVPAYLGYLALVAKSIALGDVASTNNAANYVRRNLDNINFALVDFQQIGQFGEKFRKMLSYEPKIEGKSGISLTEGGKELTLDHVSFRYPGNDKDTLSDISMTIKPGEKIAIVGENGAGKTTFVKLLMRLYDVTSGSIRYGGTDIRDFDVNKYRKVIGAVFQDYNIYAVTLGENVLMRKIEKGDENTIVDLLRKADFGRKLDSLPEGISTEMTREFSENGMNLSGGEAQKVAIARMFAAAGNEHIAILDEPSSALDPVSEYRLNKTLISNIEKSTVIFISHRLSTTRMADRIYHFENGHIIEQGTHDELMNNNGKYRKMFDRQAKNYIS